MYERFKQLADRIAGFAISASGAVALVAMTAVLAVPVADAQGRNKANWDFGSEEDSNKGQSKKQLRDKEAWEDSTESSSTVTVAASTTADVDPEASSCANFFAGQDMLVGEVCVSMDSSGVQISYELDDGFGLHEVHAWAGDNLLDMPQTGNGNPKPGRFPASAGRLGGSQSHSVTIPLSELVTSPDEFCGSSLYVAAHAALTNGESAWAGTERLTQKGNWATYFSVTVDCGSDDPDAPSIVCYDLVPMGVDAWELTSSYKSYDLGRLQDDGMIEPLSTGSYVQARVTGAGVFKLSYFLGGDDRSYSLTSIHADFGDVAESLHLYPDEDAEGFDPRTVYALTIEATNSDLVGATMDSTRAEACLSSTIPADG
ncbi:MAG: hypothetical protein WEB57_02920 [Pseudohongiellaceae bacterium]